MKKLSLILVLAVIAVALVALMVACDPPGGETQQVYFNSNNSDIALLYEQGTTNSPSTVLNSGESATFDVAISNKYDPATLTATAKNAKVSLKVTGSVDSAAMIENGYTVVGKLTISDITGTAEINFSAEEAEIAFTFKLSDNATEADVFLGELVLSDETTLAEAVNEEGYTYNLKYSEYAGTANQGIIIGGATNGTYNFYSLNGECFVGSDNGLVTGFYDHITTERNQYKIWMDTSKMALTNEIILYPEHCSKAFLFAYSDSGNIINIDSPENVDITVDNMGETKIFLKNLDGANIPGTIFVNGSEVPVTEAGYSLNKLPIEYYSDAAIEQDGAEDLLSTTYYKITTEFDATDAQGLQSFTATTATGAKLIPYQMSQVYYYDAETNTAFVKEPDWTVAGPGARNQYILDIDVSQLSTSADIIISLSIDDGEPIVFDILNNLATIEDGSQTWMGNGDNIEYRATDRDDCMIAMEKYSDGMIAHIYVLLAPAEGVENMTISFQ